MSAIAHLMLRCPRQGPHPYFRGTLAQQAIAGGAGAAAGGHDVIHQYQPQTTDRSCAGEGAAKIALPLATTEALLHGGRLATLQCR